MSLTLRTQGSLSELLFLASMVHENSDKLRPLNEILAKLKKLPFRVITTI